MRQFQQMTMVLTSRAGPRLRQGAGIGLAYRLTAGGEGAFLVRGRLFRFRSPVAVNPLG